MMLRQAQYIYFVEIAMLIGENYYAKTLRLNHADKLNVPFNIEHFSELIREVIFPV